MNNRRAIKGHKRKSDVTGTPKTHSSKTSELKVCFQTNWKNGGNSSNQWSPVQTAADRGVFNVTGNLRVGAAVWKWRRVRQVGTESEKFNSERNPSKQFPIGME